MDLTEFATEIFKIESLGKTLQCHICKNVPSPFGDETQKLRFNCCKYRFCFECKNLCDCGSKRAKLNDLLHILVLPWICQNYKNGCKILTFDIKALGKHQETCEFSDTQCASKGCHDKIQHTKIVKHIHVNHGLNVHQYLFNRQIGK